MQSQSDAWQTADFPSSRFLLRCLEIQQAIIYLYLQVAVCRKPLRIILQNVRSCDVIAGALYHITVRASQPFLFAVKWHGSSSRAAWLICRHLKGAFQSCRSQLRRGGVPCMGTIFATRFREVGCGGWGGGEQQCVLSWGCVCTHMHWKCPGNACENTHSHALYSA